MPVETSTDVMLRAEALLVKPAVAAAMLGMSRSSFDKLASAGEVGPRPIRKGSLVLWPVAELRAWVDAGCPGRVEWNARTNEQPRMAG